MRPCHLWHSLQADSLQAVSELHFVVLMSDHSCAGASSGRQHKHRRKALMLCNACLFSPSEQDNCVRGRIKQTRAPLNCQHLIANVLNSYEYDVLQLRDCVMTLVPPRSRSFML